MTNYRDPALWQGFLRLHDFPSYIEQPTEEAIHWLQQQYPDLPEEALLFKFAEQNECPDMDYLDDEFRLALETSGTPAPIR